MAAAAASPCSFDSDGLAAAADPAAPVYKDDFNLKGEDVRQLLRGRREVEVVRVLYKVVCVFSLAVPST